MVTGTHTIEKLLEENKRLRRQRRMLNHALIERDKEGSKPVTGFQYPPPAKVHGFGGR